MVFCDEKQIIFIHIPKTGGSTIETELGSMMKFDKGFGLEFYDDKLKAMQHFTWREYVEILGLKDFNKYTKFSICRNPYDKMVSEYFWTPLKVGFQGNKSMDEFIDYVEECVKLGNYSETIYHDHFMPQYMYIFNENNKLMVDKLLYFEDFDSIRKYLYKIIRRNNLRHINKNLKKRGINLNEEQKRRIYSIYKRDFELLKYER